VGFDEVLASLLGKEIEGGAEQGNGGDTLFDEAGAAFGGEIAIGAGVGEEIFDHWMIPSSFFGERNLKHDAYCDESLGSVPAVAHFFKFIEFFK
jgi:hypothetical protein